MIRRFFFAAVIVWMSVAYPAASWAQETADVPTAAEADWDRVATRAEALAGRAEVSLFAITRIRAELVAWRDVFLAGTHVNEGRIATIDAQFAALGPVPENGEEPSVVAARREDLTAQRQNLIAPRLLAQESYARANGLIGEFDAIVLQRQADALLVRGVSPLWPTYFLEAADGMWKATQLLVVETAAGFRAQVNNGNLNATLPRAGILLILGIGMIGLLRRWITAWRARIAHRDGKIQPLWVFMVSVIQIVVPVVGLFMITQGLLVPNIVGVLGRSVIEAIPKAGSIILGGWWLTRNIFPSGSDVGYLGYDADTRSEGRVAGLSIAWVLAISTFIEAALSNVDLTDGARAAVEWPLIFILGILLWRFGLVIGTKPEPRENVNVSIGRVRSVLGKVCVVVALVAPLLGAIGYGAAGRGIMVPTLYSLGVVGVVLVLQRLVHDLSRDEDDNGTKTGVFALLPVVVSLVLYLISLPIFALIWGARVDDLLEVWTKFREGFAVGESRISPTDFVTFALVFALGYLLTRFIQGSLRKTVLPRTRLDLGGQNAVVAGFGYVGIILAAIIAITSAGIDLSNLAIVAGALSVGIGFGLQNIVSNFVSGIILLIERPVSEGDWIEVGGQMGFVRSISVRSTRIETFDRTDVIIPNADLVSGQVTNWTRGNLVGRVIVPVGVAYGTDTDRVSEILREIAEAHPLVIMTPPPGVLFVGFGADSLNFEIRAILRDVNFVMATKSEMNHAIAKKFAEEGIEIPFAQRDIWLRNPEVLNKGTT